MNLFLDAIVSLDSVLSVSWLVSHTFWNHHEIQVEVYIVYKCVVKKSLYTTYLKTDFDKLRSSLLVQSLDLILLVLTVRIFMMFCFIIAIISNTLHNSDTNRDICLPSIIMLLHFLPWFSSLFYAWLLPSHC